VQDGDGSDESRWSGISWAIMLAAAALLMAITLLAPCGD
jgi:hypothetical protein